jgi:hypothetical protein
MAAIWSSEGGLGLEDRKLHHYEALLRPIVAPGATESARSRPRIGLPAHIASIPSGIVAPIWIGRASIGNGLYDFPVSRDHARSRFMMNAMRLKEPQEVRPNLLHEETNCDQSDLDGPIQAAAKHHGASIKHGELRR